jgi:hypothetical protein
MLGGKVDAGWLVLQDGEPLDEANAYLGCPYEWGGMTERGIDCSGLVHMAYRRLGRLVPRDADQQEEAGTPVDPADLHRGDLVCYGDHIAFWLGDGRMLHATGRDGIRRVLEEEHPADLAGRVRLRAVLVPAPAVPCSQSHSRSPAAVRPGGRATPWSRFRRTACSRRQWRRNGWERKGPADGTPRPLPTVLCFKPLGPGPAYPLYYVIVREAAADFRAHGCPPVLLGAALERTLTAKQRRALVDGLPASIAQTVRERLSARQ